MPRCIERSLIEMHSERERLNHIKDLKKRLEEAKHELEVAQRMGEFEKASQLRFGTIPDIQKELTPLEAEASATEAAEEDKLGGSLHDRVTSDDIARVVSKATGIPVTNLLKGERDKLVHVGLLPFQPRMLAADGCI